MMPIDEREYQDGRKNFAAGGKLRDLLERLDAADTSRDETELAKAMSHAIGFADAVLDHLRQQLVIAAPAALDNPPFVLLDSRDELPDVPR